VLLWEASDRVCGKRLKALMPVLIEAMERHGHLELGIEIRTKLLAMSGATIDRALAPVREGLGRLAQRVTGTCENTEIAFERHGLSCFSN
jgi:hypothetical protein